jgi:hypothetical protein
MFFQYNKAINVFLPVACDWSMCPGFLLDNSVLISSATRPCYPLAGGNSKLYANGIEK